MYRPLRSLREGSWFKLICGASFQHLPAVRSLTLAYALAGADCIDVAADPAVISAAQDALRVAAEILETKIFATKGDLPWQVEGLPWLMVSLNDGEDPHFRKATFDPFRCPPDCSRPCEHICPTQAITFAFVGGVEQTQGKSGVIDNLCYGCGRCVPICPVQNISTRSYVSTSEAIAPLVLAGVDAVEVHTQVGHLEGFTRLWRAIVPHLSQLKLVAISCPDGEGLIDYLHALYGLIAPLPCPLIWQTDGRPMSGDIGDGATRAAVKLGQKVVAANLPGYVQLAGGTNRHTVPKMEAMGLTRAVDRSCWVSGVAYGSYARSLLAPYLAAFDQLAGQAERELSRAGSAPSPPVLSQTAPLPVAPMQLEQVPDLLWQTVNQARTLVEPLKAMSRLNSSSIGSPFTSSSSISSPSRDV